MKSFSFKQIKMIDNQNHQLEEQWNYTFVQEKWEMMFISSVGANKRSTLILYALLFRGLCDHEDDRDRKTIIEQ